MIEWQKTKVYNCQNASIAARNLCQGPHGKSTAVIGVTSANEKIENYVNFLWGAAIAYEILLVSLNVILAIQEGAGVVYALTLLLVCLLPALSAVMYGLHKRETNAQLATEQTAAQALAEKIRQEKREDRKAAQALKMQYAANSKMEALKENKSFRKWSIHRQAAPHIAPRVCLRMRWKV